MSQTTHLDRKLLRALVHGELPLAFVARAAMDHLSELCPHCRREIAHVQRELAERRAVPAFAIPEVLARSLGELKRRHRRARRDFQAGTGHVLKR